jgi:hypothetical protein
MEFGHTFVIVKNFQVIGFNERVWIFINSMENVKNIEFSVVFLFEIQIKLQKNGFGRKKWVTNSHLGQ